MVLSFILSPESCGLAVLAVNDPIFSSYPTPKNLAILARASVADRKRYVVVSDADHEAALRAGESDDAPDDWEFGKGSSDKQMTSNGDGALSTSPDFEAARREMVARQIRGRGIRSQTVLQAMQTVPRHLFVPSERAAMAYADEPLPIGEGQTISQPFMVAAMAEALSLEGHERVLEVGAGSGYQAAVLARLANEVVAIEAQPALADRARERLAGPDYANIRIEQGDGSLGWLPRAPYDAILVSAAAPGVPQPLLDQLLDGGRLVIPVGPPKGQDLLRIVKHDGRITRQSLHACRFVPLLGRYGWRPDLRDAKQE
jgi:protein-L-isoaspartate(D-aspartate) O-methyltransferase